MAILELQNVSYAYPNGTIGIHGINISFLQGRKVALLGSNGAGKTSLIMHLNGIFKPYEGVVSYDNAALIYKKKYLQDLRKCVAVLFHNPDHQLFAPSVYEEISLGLTNISNDKNWIRKRVEHILFEFDLLDIAAHTPHKLSTGQKKRLALAAVVAMEPKVLVCDEPASNLDPYHTTEIFKIFDRLQASGTTIIISTHNVDRAYEWADKVLIMDKGRVIKAGDTVSVFKDTALLHRLGLPEPKVLQLYNCLDLLDSHESPRTITDIKKLLNKQLCKVSL